MSRILIVDDEPHLRRILASNLAQDRHQVTEAGGVEEARRAIASGIFDAIITDQKMADGEGLEVLRAAREADATVAVVFLTAFATIELAVESMRRGAFDFITKPFMPEAVLATVRRAVEHTALLRENLRLRDEVVRLEGSAEIVGSSAAIEAVRDKIARVAPTSATVLITGETGTGKDLVARAIHRSSPRAEKPFVPVNCAAFTETLLESELFGHERGAFTGADRARQGLFEAAHEGTLFLDEVAEMSPAAQAKLLRVLTDGQVMRIGSTRPRTVDVRLVAATHRDLAARVREGRFREDLYYRLAVVPIAVPPLRERCDDLAELCALFLARAARDLKLPRRKLSAQALANLRTYAFPGNVRELENLIERACILSAGDEIGAENFPVSGESSASPGAAGRVDTVARVVAPTEPVNLREYLADVEKQLLVRAMNATGGAQAEAARRLGLSRSDLAYKLNKYGIRNSSG
jgi:two-component system response regulator HydG